MILLILIISIVSLSCGNVGAESSPIPVTPSAEFVTVSWDPNAEEDLAGYTVYRGTEPGSYDLGFWVGNVTSYQFAGLHPSVRYFAVTASDFSGNESGFSREAVLASQGIKVPATPLIEQLGDMTVIDTLKLKITILNKFSDGSYMPPSEVDSIRIDFRTAIGDTLARVIFLSRDNDFKYTDRLQLKNTRYYVNCIVHNKLWSGWPNNTEYFDLSALKEEDDLTIFINIPQ